MDLSQETGAAASGLEHEGSVQTRTLLPVGMLISLLVALSASGPALAQTAPTAPPPAAAQAPPAAQNVNPGPGTPAAPINSSDVPRVLHLDDAVQTALKQQPQLIEARANLGAAEGRVTQARSPLLPQINGIASYQRIHNGAGTLTSTTPGVTPSLRPSTYNSWNFGVSGNQLLWDFGQTWYAFRSSEKLAASFAQTAYATEIQIVLGVRTSFFQARATRDLVRVAQETLDNQLKHQQQVEGFVRVGTQPEIDLVTARTNVANARVQLITAQNNDRIAKAQLNQAIGLPQGTDYQVSDEELPPIEGEAGSIAPLFDTALSSRPEIASLEYSRQSREALLASARGAWGPSIGFSGGFAKQGQDPGSLYDTWNFGFTLNWPLFQGGLTYGRVHEAEQNLKSATAALTVEQLQVRFDVEQAQATIIGNKESVTAAQDALLNAREQLRLAEGRYQAGVGNVIELSDAQVALTNAGAQLVQAQYNLSTARARLLAALGREQ
jgi:outer membrane protein